MMAEELCTDVNVPKVVGNNSSEKHHGTDRRIGDAMRAENNYPSSIG